MQDRIAAIHLSPAAYGRSRQEAFQGRLAGEQAMAAQMSQMAWDEKPGNRPATDGSAAAGLMR